MHLLWLRRKISRMKCAFWKVPDRLFWIRIGRSNFKGCGGPRLTAVDHGLSSKSNMKHLVFEPGWRGSAYSNFKSQNASIVRRYALNTANFRVWGRVKVQIEFKKNRTARNGSSNILSTYRIPFKIYSSGHL